MDERQLRNFMAVIERGSLGRAAEALNISQPALTKSIRRLEERLGVPLFHRETRGMRPTPYGEALRDHARQIATGIDQALREIDAMRAGSEGTVRLAAGPLVSDEILSRAVVLLQRGRPGIRINIHTAIGDPRDGLLAGIYDFVLAVLPLESTSQRFRQQMLFEDRISVIAAAEHPLAKPDRVSARDLANASWVLPVAGHHHRRRLENVFHMEGLPPPVPDIECSSTEFIKSVVANTRHLGLIAHMGLRNGRHETDRAVREVAIRSALLVRPIAIIWRQNQVLSRSSRFFIEAIEAVCTGPATADGMTGSTATASAG